MLIVVFGGSTCVVSPRTRLCEWNPVDFGMKTMEPYKRRVSYSFASVSINGSELSPWMDMGSYHHSKASL